MNIFIEIMFINKDSEFHQINLEKNTLTCLKNYIYNQYNINPINQDWYFNNNLLDNSQNISENNNYQLLINNKMINIQFLIDNKKINLPFENLNLKIKDLRDILSINKKYKFIFNNKLMDDDKLLNDYNIYNNSIVYVKNNKIKINY